MATVERLREYLSYDPLTGRFLWIRNKARARVGDEVGWVDEYGYRRTKFDGQTLWLHVVAWEFEHGPVPDGFEVDHRDGDQSNNAAINLRLATKSQNMQNMKMRRSNKTGVKGVNWHKDNGKFQVQITCNRKKIHGGYFDTVEEAAIAARSLRTQVHGEFARHA